LVLAALFSLVACGSDPEPGAAPGTTAPPEAGGDDHVHHAQQLFEVGTETAADGRHETHLATVEGGEVVMIEVTAHEPGDEPTRAQRRDADDFVERAAAATKGLERLDDAEAAGYRSWPGIDQYHFVNLDHVGDGAVLDPARPEFLMYDDDGALLAAMFLAADNDEPGPQFGGPLTTWHYHPAGPSCWVEGGLLPADVDPDGDGSCPDGATYSERSPEMLHVWLVDHAEGPFSSDMVTPVLDP
jgi:hypothetical protein